VRIVIPERIQVQERDKALIRKEVEIVEVEKEMSRWQNFIQMLGIGVLLAFAVWLIIKVRQLVI
jgi:predicted nucleic acid-binding Zn ribbon protein